MYPPADAAVRCLVQGYACSIIYPAAACSPDRAAPVSEHVCLPLLTTICAVAARLALGPRVTGRRAVRRRTAVMPKTRSGRLVFGFIVCAALLVISRNLYHLYLNRAIFDAIETGNVTAARSLLARGADANSIRFIQLTGERKERQSALDAALIGQETIACLLIEHGANLRKTPPAHSTYLQDACDRGRVALVRCLLEHGADLNASDSSHDTALSHAIRYRSTIVDIHPIRVLPVRAAISSPSGAGLSLADASDSITAEGRTRYLNASRQMIALLLAHGARYTALDAVQLEDADLLQKTLDAGADPNQQEQYGQSPLYAATEKGSLPLMRILLEHGADVNHQETYSGSALNAAAGYAVSKANIEAVRLLLTHGANVDTVSKYAGSPLINAIANKHADIARLLMAHHANPAPNPVGSDSSPQSALAAAARSLPQLVPELLARGADVNANNGQPLHAAISAHRPGLARYLLEHGAKIYPPLPNPALKTAVAASPGNLAGGPAPPAFLPSTLRVAVMYGPESFDLLMQAGADITPDTPDILLAAASAGHALLFDRLIALGANVNATADYGKTPLTEAFIHAPSGVKTLIEHGANPNVVAGGQTPLILATLASRRELVRLLLAHGANANFKLSYGHTALYFARRHPDPVIINMLTQAGVKDE